MLPSRHFSVRAGAGKSGPDRTGAFPQEDRTVWKSFVAGGECGGRGGGVRHQGLVCEQEDRGVRRQRLVCEHVDRSQCWIFFLDGKIAPQPFWLRVHIGLVRSRKPFCPGSTPMALISRPCTSLWAGSLRYLWACYRAGIFQFGAGAGKSGPDRAGAFPQEDRTV